MINGPSLFFSPGSAAACSTCAIRISVPEICSLHPARPLRPSPMTQTAASDRVFMIPAAPAAVPFVFFGCPLVPAVIRTRLGL